MNREIADIVVAYVTHHQHASIDDIVRLSKALGEEAPPPKDTYTDDYITCLEDGEKVVLLKRHLSTKFNMTPEEYIAKWNLPPDYPMVAKTYSEKRSQIAKDQGLGTTKPRPRKAPPRSRQ